METEAKLLSCLKRSVVGLMNSGGNTTVAGNINVNCSSDDVLLLFEIPNQAKIFKGRDQDIARLNEIYFGKQKKTRAVISALPGYGKTELCKKFGKLCLNEKKIEKVFWVNIESINSEILLNLKKFYKEFQENLCLFIFDGVTSGAEIANFEPPFEKQNFLLLVTSQASDWGEDMESIRLEPLSDDASLEIFKEILGNKYNEEDCSLYKELGNIVSNVPLGIHVLAGSLKQEIDVINDLKEYVAQVKKNERTFKKSIHQTLRNSYTKSMFAAMSPSFEKIKDQNDEDEDTLELAQKILCICSYLNPNNMSFEEINKIINSKGEMYTESKLKSTLKFLKNLCFINYVVNNDGGFIEMYRASQEISRIYFKKMNEEYFKACLDGLINGVISADHHKSSILFHVENNENIIQNICDSFMGKHKATKFVKLDMKNSSQEEETLKKILVLLVENGCVKNIKLIFDKMNDGTIKQYIQKFELLHAAAENNQKELLQMFLKYVDVNVTDSKGMTPLDVATKYGATEILEFLRDQGAEMNVTETPQKSMTKLHKAASRGQVNNIKQFLENPDQMTKKDKYGNIPLFQLVNHCPTNFTKENWKDLLKISQYEKNISNNANVTLLHCAVKKGNLLLIETILEEVKININYQDNQKRTPLHYINYDLLAYDKIMEITNYFIKNKALFNIKDLNGDTSGNMLLCYAIDNNLEWLAKLLEYICVNETYALHYAVEIGNIEAINKLLENKPEVNAQDQENKTPLHVAAQTGNVEATKILLKYGADVHAKDKDGNTPLIWASWEGKVEVVQILLEHKSDVNATSRNLATALHEAGEEGNIEVVKLLLHYGANINAQDNKGGTSLHWAADEENLEPMILFLESGIDKHIQNNDGCTALHIATDEENIEAMKVLLKYGSNVNIQNNDGNTALHKACETENIEAMQLLLQYKPNINIKNGCNNTVLHMAITSHNVEAVELLLKYGVNLNSPDYDTVLHFPVGSENIEVVDLLLKFNANPNMPDYDNEYTPLHLAAELGDIKILKLLLENNADVHARNKNNYTPLLTAIEFENIDAMRILLDFGASPNDKRDGVSALHYTVQEGYLRGMLELFRANADPNVQDINGKTPLHWAAERGEVRAIRMLLDYGAKPNAQDRGGNTSLHLVMYNIPNLTPNEIESIIYELRMCGASCKIPNIQNCTSVQLLKNMKQTRQIDDFRNLYHNLTCNMENFRNVHYNENETDDSEDETDDSEDGTDDSEDGNSDDDSDSDVDEYGY